MTMNDGRRPDSPENFFARVWRAQISDRDLSCPGQNALGAFSSKNGPKCADFGASMRLFVATILEPTTDT